MFETLHVSWSHQYVHLVKKSQRMRLRLLQNSKNKSNMRTRKNENVNNGCSIAAKALKFGM